VHTTRKTSAAFKSFNLYPIFTSFDTIYSYKVRHLVIVWNITKLAWSSGGQKSTKSHSEGEFVSKLRIKRRLSTFVAVNVIAEGFYLIMQGNDFKCCYLCRNILVRLQPVVTCSVTSVNLSRKSASRGCQLVLEVLQWLPSPGAPEAFVFPVNYTEDLTTLQIPYFYQSTDPKSLGKLLTVYVRVVQKCLLINWSETFFVF
jgi:hypothetical protein